MIRRKRVLKQSVEGGPISEHSREQEGVRSSREPARLNGFHQKRNNDHSPSGNLKLGGGFISKNGGGAAGLEGKGGTIAQQAV